MIKRTHTFKDTGRTAEVIFLNIYSEIVVDDFMELVKKVTPDVYVGEFIEENAEFFEKNDLIVTTHQRFQDEAPLVVVQKAGFCA